MSKIIKQRLSEEIKQHVKEFMEKGYKPEVIHNKPQSPIYPRKAHFSKNGASSYLDFY